MKIDSTTPLHGCRSLCAGYTARSGSSVSFMAAPIKDLTGKQFGTLKVIRLLPKDRTGRTASREWECFCTACKKTVARTTENLKAAKSCGCLRMELIRQGSIKHGACVGGYIIPEFKSWIAARARCKNKNNPNYGGRGITMCPRWYNSFKEFLVDLGACPEGYSLERKDNNKGYWPGNCKWASDIDQANNKRNNRLLTFKGKTQSLSQWARELGLTDHAIRGRLDLLHWTVEKALETPRCTTGNFVHKNAKS